MRSTYFITLLMSLFICHALISQIQIGSNIDGIGPQVQFGKSISMPDPITVAVGAPSSGYYGYSENGAVVYQYNGSEWAQKGNGIGQPIGEGLGMSVFMPDSNTIAVGAPGSYESVRIYYWMNNQWNPKGNHIMGESSGDKSGWSISMPDPNTIAIGAIRNSEVAEHSGHVRVFEWNGIAWIQKGNDLDGIDDWDKFGYSVSMPDDNTVAIGAPAVSYHGYVKVFTWDGTSWVLKGSILENPETNGGFGNAVYMPDTNTIAIGSPTSDINGTFTGTVRVYNWDGNEWTQKGSNIHGEYTNVGAGHAISMPNINTIAFAETGYNAPELNYSPDYAGRVRIFNWNGQDWQYALEIVGESPAEHFGRAISMPSNDIIAIGAPRNDDNGYDAGQARIFGICNSPPDTTISDIGNALISNAEEISYQWIDCDNNNQPIFGATSQAFNPTMSGNYAVILTNGECSYTTGCISVTILSYQDIEFQNHIVVFPNPSNGKSTIDLGAEYQEVSIQIRSLSGEIISSGNHDFIQRVELSLEDRKGIFIVEISTKDFHKLIPVIID